MLNQPKYDKLRNACWTATGCLLTADGSDDHLVKPEGLPEFQVPPPTSQIHDAEPKSNIYEVSPFDGETESEMDMLVGIIDQILLKQWGNALACRNKIILNTKKYHVQTIF